MHQFPAELLVVNPNTSAEITQLIDRQVRSHTPNGYSARCRTADWGTPSVETHIDATVASLAVLDALSSETDVSGVLIAAFGDPGLEAARELMPVPVVGIGESAIREALEHGPFAILTVQPTSLPLIHGLLRVNDRESKCVAAYALPIPVLAAAEPEKLRTQLLEAAAALADTYHLSSIVLGGGPLGVHAQPLEDALGITCIDPVAAGIRRLIAEVERGDASARAPRPAPKVFQGDFAVLDHLNRTIRH